jgi:hypothetical protein
MTLILGALSHDYAVQVSDRRITGLADGALRDDHRNKATMYCGVMAFAYSGLAEIEGHTTDEWIARTIAPAMTLQETHDLISDHATRAFAAISAPPSMRRQAFCGIGWAETAWSDGLVPGQSIISNALTTSGEWNDIASATFTVTGQALSRAKAYRLVPPIGAKLRDDFNLLERNVGRCIERKTSALEVVRLLGESIRRTALVDQSVGRSLLAVVIPRPSQSAGMTMFLTPVAPSGFGRIDHPMFFTIPADSEELAWNTPNFVCNGAVMIRARFEQGQTEPPNKRLQPTARRKIVNPPRLSRGR